MHSGELSPNNITFCRKKKLLKALQATSPQHKPKNHAYHLNSKTILIVNDPQSETSFPKSYTTISSFRANQAQLAIWCLPSRASPHAL